MENTTEEVQPGTREAQGDVASPPPSNEAQPRIHVDASEGVSVYPIDVDTGTVAPGTLTVRFDDRDGSVFIDLHWSRENPAGRTGGLHVEYGHGPGRPSRVTLDLFEGLTPTALARFPWATYLAVADAAKSGLNDETGPGVVEAMRRAQEVPDRGRRGPAGRGDAFYREIALRYSELRSMGSTNPTSTIAQEYQVSPGTAAGWVHRARRKNFLTTAPPGSGHRTEQKTKEEQP
jgi:hypothetical protein